MKMVPSLPLLSCESSVSVKKALIERKKNLTKIMEGTNSCQTGVFRLPSNIYDVTFLDGAESRGPFWMELKVVNYSRKTFHDKTFDRFLNTRIGKYLLKVTNKGSTITSTDVNFGNLFLIRKDVFLTYAISALNRCFP